MDSRHANVAIDIFLAERIVQWWMEPSDPQRCRHAYHFELKFRNASDEEILEAVFYYLNVRHPENCATGAWGSLRRLTASARAALIRLVRIVQQIFGKRFQVTSSFLVGYQLLILFL